jgi:hypothetical protein
LWATGVVVAALDVGLFFFADRLHLDVTWVLYVVLNMAFSLLAIWKFRSWFRQRQFALLLTAWLVVHALVYGLLTYINFPAFFCIVLFPVEIKILSLVGLEMRAKNLDEKLVHAKRY